MKTAIEGSEGPQAFPAQVMKRGDVVMGDDFLLTGFDLSCLG